MGHPDLIVSNFMVKSVGPKWVPRWYFFCGSFMFFYLAFAVPLCGSVFMCLVVTCWERADLLALVRLGVNYFGKVINYLQLHWSFFN